MKIAFASCGNSSACQPVWGIIKRQSPDLLLLLGDNVYIGKAGYRPPASFATMEEELDRKYIDLWNESHFYNLFTTVPYLAVWDNHDFGLPGAKYLEEEPLAIIYGAYVPQEHRELAFKLFNKHMKPRSLRPIPQLYVLPQSPIYCQHTDATGKIKFIMLDVRSAQEDPKNNPAAKLMDDCQLNWLREEILQSTAEIHVICSGLTFTLGGNGKNGWAKHINWFEEFSAMVASSGKKTLFLGGNIHCNRFKKHIVTNGGGLKKLVAIIFDMFGLRLPPGCQYLYEAISSGVGRKFDDGDEDNNGMSDNPDDTLASRPRNNYGILDFTEALVKISLYGQYRNDMHYIEINRANWKLNTWQLMKKK